LQFTQSLVLTQEAILKPGGLSFQLSNRGHHSCLFVGATTTHFCLYNSITLWLIVIWT
jgi:hypothetical protein